MAGIVNKSSLLNSLMSFFDQFSSSRPEINHDELGERSIVINDSIKNGTFGFLHNGVSTGKYNIVTFLPLFLKEQFLTKYANMFFLLTGAVQLIPDVSPTGKFGSCF